MSIINKGSCLSDGNKADVSSQKDMWTDILQKFQMWEERGDFLRELAQEGIVPWQLAKEMEKEDVLKVMPLGDNHHSLLVGWLIGCLAGWMLSQILNV